MKKSLYFILGVIIVVLPLSSCMEKDQSHELLKHYAVMGGVDLEIKLYKNGENEKKAVRAAYARVKQVDDTCNIYDSESELSKLNKSAFKKSFKCSDLLWDLLMKAKSFYKLSDGAFDISAGPLMTLWGFHRKHKTLPSQDDIKKVKKIIGLDKVAFDISEKSIRFLEKGMKLDLGGIAKGYAVELAVGELKHFGVNQGIVNLAGNAYCFSIPPPQKNFYNVGVRDPFKKNRVCGVVKILNASVATSGNYERFVTINGKKYAHIMNPVTCKPIENVYGVTVITPNSTASDALSTAVFIKGEEFAKKICDEIPNTSILIISSENDMQNIRIKKLGKHFENCEINL